MVLLILYIYTVELPIRDRMETVILSIVEKLSLLKTITFLTVYLIFDCVKSD